MDRDGLIVQAYGSSAGLFQVPAAELTGRSLSAALPAATWDCWVQHLNRVFEGETCLLTESLDEGQRVYAVSVFPLRDESGSIRYAGGLAFDITRTHVTEAYLRSTALEVLRSQEITQGRISKFLHDEVGQSLTAAGMQLDILRMDFEATVPDISARTAEIQRMLEVVVDRIRDLSYELNPAIVERAGFHGAMDRLAGRFRRSFKGTLRLMSDSSLHIPSEIGSALYRIAQEAVDNAIQHACCSQIELLVKATQAGPTLEVRDNGRGFDPRRAQRKLGLLLMEHYAGESGLRLCIESQEGRGTLVRVVWERKSSIRK